MYSNPRLLTKPMGNNALSYREGRTLHVPALVKGGFADIKPGTETAFEDIEDGARKSCTGLERFILSEWNGIPLYVFDNHNHALAFWCDAVSSKVATPGFPLVHIDQHSDLWPNDSAFDIGRIGDDAYVETFVDERTNVGSYIVPTLGSGLCGSIVRIEGEPALDRIIGIGAPEGSVLNLDMDFFAPVMDVIPFAKKKEAILKCAQNAAVITIATSPFFIEQNLAIRKIGEIFG
jgi:hypothetical protein